MNNLSSILWNHLCIKIRTLYQLFHALYVLRLTEKGQQQVERRHLLMLGVATILQHSTEYQHSCFVGSFVLRGQANHAILNTVNSQMQMWLIILFWAGSFSIGLFLFLVKDNSFGNNLSCLLGFVKEALSKIKVEIFGGKSLTNLRGFSCTYHRN